jgi:hypothetical protein
MAGNPKDPLQRIIAGHRTDVSRNERAERIMGNRQIEGIVLDHPAELGYHCPNCRYDHYSLGLDDRLVWSEHEGFLWCSVCNHDWPSALCLADPIRATDIFLTLVEEAVARAVAACDREGPVPESVRPKGTVVYPEGGAGLPGGSVRGAWDMVERMRLYSKGQDRRIEVAVPWMQKISSAAADVVRGPGTLVAITILDWALKAIAALLGPEPEETSG